VLTFFIAGLLFVPRARRTLGAYRIPLETGLLIHLINAKPDFYFPDYDSPGNQVVFSFFFDW
jgi:hypothetical protein